MEKEGHNPFVRAQVFVRKGPGAIHGIDEAVAIFDKYSNLVANGGRVYALEEGDAYDSKDTVMVIEARVQDIVELETIYLGVIAAETTKANDGVEQVNLEEVEARTRKVVDLLGGRPLTYFGPRHWRYDEDADIAQATFRGGAVATSSDIGAERNGTVGVGTIPHALENIYAALHGKENAVVEATLAFDRIIDPSVPRIALVDYNNKEVTDSVAVAQALEGRLSAVRIDTCGENLAEGAFARETDIPSDHPLALFTKYISEEDKKYWFGTGVTVSGVFAVRRALDAAGFEDVEIGLTSGFGNAEKVAAFRRAEALLQVKLFDFIGAGGFYKPCRASTMDIVAVADDLSGLDANPVSKVGRSYRPNPELRLVLERSRYHACKAGREDRECFLTTAAEPATHGVWFFEWKSGSPRWKL